MPFERHFIVQCCPQFHIHIDHITKSKVHGYRALGTTKFSGQKLEMSQALKHPVHQSTLIILSLFLLLGNEHNPVVHLGSYPCG